MFRFEIEIHLDNPLQANPSKGVSGTLKVIANEECKCRKLVLYCQSGLLEPEELDKNKVIDVTVAKWETWEAGEEYSYPFHFEVDGSWTGRGEQEGSTIEWFFLPEIHITGEFQPDTSIGWILAKDSLLESSSKVLEPFEEGGDDSTLFGNQDANADVNLETKKFGQTDESVNLVSPDLLDGLEELEKVLNDEYGNRPTELSTKEGFFIRINFDNRNRIYRIGEIISGNVVIRAFGEFEVEWLGLAYQWRTHGRAELEEGELNQITVSENEKWRVGQLYEYRFSFVIEDGPTTYRGHNQNLDWYVQPELKAAKDQANANNIADILKAAGTDFLLIPKKGSMKIGGEPASMDEQLLKLDWARVPYSEEWIFLVLAVLLSVSGIVIVAFLAIDRQISFWVWLILSGISLLPLYWVFNETTSYKLAELRTGPVEIQISSLDSSNGIRGKIQFQPRESIHIERLIMELVVKEKVTRYEGTRLVTSEKTLFSRSDVNNIKQDLVKGIMFVSELKIADIPDTVLTQAFTKFDGKLELPWTVTISIVIGNWYDWKRKIPIQVTR